MVFRLREQVAERVRAEGLDIFVGVLCALHLQDTHAHLELFEDADRALRRLLPRAVVIVGDDDLARVARQEPRLLRRERRAERGDRTVKSRLVQTRHVDVALCQYDIPAFRLFSQIEREQIVALAENDGFRAVHVLRLPVAEDAPGEADDVAAHVDDREHEPVAERVVHAARFPVAHEPAVKELLLRVAERLHRAHEAVPRVGRKAETEARHGLRRELPAGEIVARDLPGGGLELRVEKARSVPVEREQPLALFRAGVVRLLRQLHTGAVGQKRHRLGEREILDLHDEADDAAALAAAEAVVDLLVRRDGERRRLFAVKRAEPEEVRPAFFRQAHVAAHDVDNVVALGELL